ncbi:MAG: hypothetical protein BroJett033_1680 [Chloroflexota bacterium]|nr:MAG: hypothetical protein BroJett033_1680 [Chloroflexota bacterium]
MRGLRGLVILTVIVGILALALNAVRLRLEQPWRGGAVVAQEYRLDKALDDSLTALAQVIALGPQAQVNGSAAFIGSSVYLAGTVNGDLTAISDSITLAPTNAVSGSALLLADTVVLDGQLAGQTYARGAHVTIQPGAAVTGSLYVCGGLNDLRAGAAPPLPCDASALDLWPAQAAVPPALTTLGLAAAAFGSVIVGALAVLAVTLFPRRLSYMAEAVRRRPRSLGQVGLALGLLTLGLGGVYLLLLAALPPVGLLLLPLLLLAAVALTMLTVGGWVTLALLMGDALLRWLARASFPPLVSAAVGSAALAAIWNSLLLLPFGGWLPLAALVALAVVGMGAAAVTRLGTRALHESYLVQG